MRKYVSAEDAINRIMDAMLIVQARDDDLYNTGLRRAISIIASMSAADVVEVVHGRWIKKEILHCSKCDMPTMHPLPYCQKCGAKMDGGVIDA